MSYYKKFNCESIIMFAIKINIIVFASILLIWHGKLFKVQRVKSLKYHWKISGHLSIVAKECEQEEFHGIFKFDPVMVSFIEI